MTEGWPRGSILKAVRPVPDWHITEGWLYIVNDAWNNIVGVNNDMGEGNIFHKDFFKLIIEA